MNQVLTKGEKHKVHRTMDATKRIEKQLDRVINVARRTKAGLRSTRSTLQRIATRPYHHRETA